MDLMNDEERAAYNLRTQERLLLQLKVGVMWEGPEVIAQRLGYKTTEEFEEYFAKGDFTMTELRLLAIATRLCIDYPVTVDGMAHDYEEKLQG